MRLEQLKTHPLKQPPFIGWCSVCKGTFKRLTHADLDGPAFLSYVCDECVKKRLDKQAVVS